MGVILVAIFFFCAGLIFVFWPMELRDWILQSYVHMGFKEPLFMQKEMFTPSYILSFKVAGVLEIFVSGFLVCFYFRRFL